MSPADDPPGDPPVDRPVDPPVDVRLAELERRVAALEQTVGPPSPVPLGTGDFWALEGLRARTGEDAGGVLFTGIVGTPDGRRYEWQETRPVGDLLDADWSEAAGSFAALGQPVRLQLLREVLLGRGSAAELAELDAFGTSGQVYHHLRQLTAAGWLRPVTRGRWEVPPERVIPLLAAIAIASR